MVGMFSSSMCSFYDDLFVAKASFNLKSNSFSIAIWDLSPRTYASEVS